MQKLYEHKQHQQSDYTSIITVMFLASLMRNWWKQETVSQSSVQAPVLHQAQGPDTDSQVRWSLMILTLKQDGP